MNFTVLERLTLLNTLPAEGDLTTLRIIRRLRESLSFSEAEHTALGFTQETSIDGQGKQLVRWKTDAPQEADIQIGPKAAEIIKTTLQALSERRQLTEGHLSLCDKFLPDEGKET
jgi:hypothetical protein